MTKWPTAAPILLLGLAASVAARAQQTTEFTRGEIRFKVDTESYAIPLSQLAGSSSLMAAGPGRWVLGLNFRAPRRPGQFMPYVRFALSRVTGPRSYGGERIGNLVVETEEGNPWNFSPERHRCTITLTRVQAAGVEGTITCTGTGENPVSFGEMTFRASP